jgi:hypothetical protein
VLDHRVAAAPEVGPPQGTFRAIGGGQGVVLGRVDVCVLGHPVAIR